MTESREPRRNEDPAARTEAELARPDAELARALPVEPVDASLRMRVQRLARAAHERREEGESFFWQDALVPGALVIAGLFYAAGALQKLAEIFG